MCVLKVVHLISHWLVKEMLCILYIYIFNYIGYFTDVCRLKYWGDPDVDGRIILRWVFRKWEGVVATGWSWLRIGTGGGRLWVR